MARTPTRCSVSRPSTENDPRPLKRVKLDSTPPSSPLPVLTETESSELSKATAQLSIQQAKPEMRRLPPHILLLAIPNLLTLPPDHLQYQQSLRLSLLAARKCVLVSGSMGDLEVEVRARVTLVEVGMKIYLGKRGQEDWDMSLFSEVSLLYCSQVNLRLSRARLRRTSRKGCSFPSPYPL